MCGRYVLVENLAHLVDHPLEEPPEQVVGRYNVAPTQMVPVLRASEEGDTWRFDAFRWGLVPSWAKDKNMRQNLFNARGETLAEKPAFRSAFRKRRCLVPATGFYEWAGPAGDRRTFFIRRKDGEPLLFAGLWERWDGDGSEPPLYSFTIVTTEANAEMSEFHHRMPVILDKEGQERWLDPNAPDMEALKALLVPLPDGSLEITRVGTWVNRAGNEGPRCLDPFEGEGGLFEG
ncbi:MAG: SOS response-associated peptidase [Planctomycetota bacterium]